jgi:hypothetical protein
VHEQLVDEHVLAHRDAVRLAEHEPLVGLAAAVHGLDHLLSTLVLPRRELRAPVDAVHAPTQAPRAREADLDDLEHLLAAHLQLHELGVVVELVVGRRDGQRRRLGHAEQRDHDLLEHGLVHERGLLQDHDVRALAAQTWRTQHITRQRSAAQHSTAQRAYCSSASARIGRER